MDLAIKKHKIQSIIESYLMVHKEEPYEDLKLLQKYLKKKNIGKVKLKKLKKLVDESLEDGKKREQLEKMEARLFTNKKKPRDYKYGKAFCENCNMYKDYKKECPYCGTIEYTN